MFSQTDIRNFENVCKPLLNLGTINQELFGIALLAAKEHIKGVPNQNTGQKPRLLTLSEVAEMLKCSEKQIDRLRKAGKLQTVRYSPRKVSILYDDVEKLISTSVTQ